MINPTPTPKIVDVKSLERDKFGRAVFVKIFRNAHLFLNNG